MPSFAPPVVNVVEWDGSDAAYAEIVAYAGEGRVARGVELVAIVVTRPADERPDDRFGTETVVRAALGEFVVFDPGRPLEAEVLRREHVARRYPGLLDG